MNRQRLGYKSRAGRDMCFGGQGLVTKHNRCKAGLLTDPTTGNGSLTKLNTNSTQTRRVDIEMPFNSIALEGCSAALLAVKRPQLASIAHFLPFQFDNVQHVLLVSNTLHN